MSTTIAHPSTAVNSVQEHLDSDREKKLQISASTIGKIITKDQCPRYSRLRVDKKLQDSVLEGNNRGWNDFNPLNSILANEGQRFENMIYKRFEDHAQKIIETYRPEKKDGELEITKSKLETIKEHIASGVMAADESDPSDAPIIMLQTPLRGFIGQFSIVGYTDLILVWPEEDGVTIRVIDIKASWEEKTSHQLQTATYTKLLREVLDEYAPDVNYTMEGGVLNRESEYTYPDKHKLPKFELRTREKNIERMLSTKGEIYQSLIGAEQFKNVEYQLDGVCESCEYRQVCYADSYDRADIALLGISRGEQEALREAEIRTVHEVADLTYEKSTFPGNFEQPDIKPVHRETVQELPTGLQLKIGEISQQAKEMLAFMEPDNENAAGETYYFSSKGGTGFGSLPDDDPSNQYMRDNLEYTPEHLIKVYMNVRHDYVTDRTVMLSATIDSTAFTDDPIQISHSIEDIPTTDEYEFIFEQLDKYESDLLDEFTTELYKAIDTVACAIGEYPQAAMHFYFYQDSEVDALTESLKRHRSDTNAIDSFRDLLSLREGPEQQIYSVVQDEIQNRFHIDQMPTSLVSVRKRFHPSDESYKVQREDETIIDSNGDEVNLRRNFSTKLFDFEKPYEYSPVIDEEGKTTAYVKFREEQHREDDKDMAFSAEHRGAEIPLEYIWASEEVDILNDKWIAQIKRDESELLNEEVTDLTKHLEQLKGSAKYFAVVNRGTLTEKRRRLEHVEEMGKLMTMYLRQVEAGIKFKSASVEKETIDIPSLNSFRLNKDFSGTLEDYLDMEFMASKKEVMGHYRLPLRQRIQKGKSIPVKIRDIEKVGHDMVIRGDLAYEEVGFDNPTLMAASCRESGPGDGTGGSWMVASIIKPDGDTFIEANGGSPTDIINEPKATISEIDTDNLSIEFTHNSYSGDSKYGLWNAGFTTDASEQDKFNKYITPGMYLVLDKQVNDYIPGVSTIALNNTANNTSYNLMESLRSETAELQIDSIDRKYMRKFLKWMRKTDDDIIVTPNRKQRRFVRDVSSKVHILQGPPGTGKTSGATATAVTGRMYAASKQEELLRGLVTGSSNKAIDEVAEQVSETVGVYQDYGDGDELDNIELIRITRNPPSDAEKAKNVKYLHYGNPQDMSEINLMLERLDTGGVGLSNTGEERQLTLGESESESPAHTIVFVTPTTLFGLMKRHTEDVGAEEVYEAGPDLFDLMCVDEASMMPLPQFILGGAFVSEDGQWLIAGDHRQMPPVQQYNWLEETRRPVEEYIPYLSTLNYFRYLRGDDITEFVSDEDLLDTQPNNPGVEVTGLEVTYRCHKRIADFLQEWVYTKDDIEYRSDQVYQIPQVTTGTAGIQEALRSESPLTVIIHDDTTSQQFNTAEAEIATALGKNIPKSETQGIVTPHNSQKGFMKSLYKDASVDTVERFQGGQRDVMMVSATVSDPDFISTESEFIFDPRRLNVALSRMKKKLIVIAPRSLFNYVPEEIELYQKSVIWTGLYEEVNADDDPAWSGTMDDFIGGSKLAPDVNVEVYHA